jgi:C-terminal processing protease CtpA/Prc
MKSSSNHIKFTVAFLAIVLLQACDKNEEPQHPNAHVNDWIYTNMDFWYYWTNELPDDPDKTLEPSEFFASLKSEKDRFSWIQENYQELLNSLRGVSKESGIEFALYRETPDGINVFAQVQYVKKNSPASQTSIKRGDIITLIDGQQITTENYQILLQKLGETHTLSFKSLNVDAQTFGDTQMVTITPVEYAENPNFFHKVYDYNGHKIGYYIYNLFSNGTTSTSQEYSNEMDLIFANFKAAGITDLVIDLRYNSGGAETAAKNLASLIGKNIDASKIFTRHEFNEAVTNEVRNDPQLGESFLNVNFISKAQNVGSMLGEGRVYILTGTRTASASEQVINGLAPFMDVFLIGGKTVGKNLGSITLYDEDDPENKWGIQPIVTKSLNSLNQSDYDTGFNPQILDADNSRFIYPLGDPRERLLNIALKQITGLTDIGKTRTQPVIEGELMGHSLDFKRRTGVLDIGRLKK